MTFKLPERVAAWKFKNAAGAWTVCGPGGKPRGEPGSIPLFTADQMLAAYEQGKAENAVLRSALDRVTANFRLLLSSKPVRDVSETLAEADAALKATQDGAEERG